MNFKEIVKKVYWFLFKDDSIWSWLVNLVLAFIIVKFLIYPALALILGTQLPLVAVISGSMEHDGLNFEEFWDEKGEWYETQGITKEMFREYDLKNGFNKGDVIILYNPDDIEVGEVGVYASDLHQYPIIHRVIKIDENGYIFKGDHNSDSDPYVIQNEQLLGKALFKVPMIGWIKIWFAELVGI